MTRAAATPKGASPEETARAHQRAAVGFVEHWLDQLLPPPGSPPSRLHVAMREAVFPGGKRARPLLTRLVAETCGDGRAETVGRMCAAVELVHCASLVHDDLPAFDNAAERRGKPSCHAMFGEATGILVGDALLTLAFEALAGAPLDAAPTVMRLSRLLAEATGSRAGIIGGQGLELQTNIDLDAYHMQKTSALFRAAAAGGAIAAGRADESPRWARFGELIGRALQLADDLDDCLLDPAQTGKPSGQDALHGRPNAVGHFGVDEVRATLRATVAEALEVLGPTPSESTADGGPALAALRTLIDRISGRHLERGG